MNQPVGEIASYSPVSIRATSGIATALKSLTKTTVLDRLGTQADEQGDTVAFTYLESDDQRTTITYRELDRRARNIALHMSTVAAKGDRALMMYSSGLEFIEAFLGCLYAGILAVPAYPPRKNRNVERILAIAHDCEPTLLLCTTESRTEAVDELAASLGGSTVLATDELTSGARGNLPDIAPREIAFLQYTSGSTSSPKGVMVSHANLTANQKSIQRAFNLTSSSVLSSWLPAYHDMGLIGIALQPPFVGCHTVLMSPVSFLAKPSRWLQAISDHQVTISGGPNFSYEHCLSLVTDEQCEGIDLSSWNIAFNGSEPVREETLSRFCERFGHLGFSQKTFFPCYGLAEATLFVSGGPADSMPQHELIDSMESTAGDNYVPSNLQALASVTGCGEVSDDLELAVVDPNTQQTLADGHVGEIWIRGPGISKGYWRKPALNQELFSARLSSGSEDRVAYLRTGDLGFLKGGELFVTGRLIDLIIIRGRNIYPQDVEAIVKQQVSSSAANSVAAFTVFNDGTEHLAVVIEGSRELVRLAAAISKGGPNGSARGLPTQNRHRATLAAIRHSVGTAFDVNVDYFAFLPPGKLPRTSSGKIQRRACRNALLNGDLPFLELPGCVSILNRVSRGPARLHPTVEGV